MDADPAKPQEFTVDQLAQHAELPVSTIRMYQQRGLIEPPEKRGRVGYYGSGHRERLRLIARLQSRGFSLAAIKEAIDSWNSGQSLDELLGTGDLAPTLVRETLRLSPAELADRFEGVEMTQVDMQRAAAIGLIELDGSDVVVTNPPFAEIGPAVARLGVPVSEMLDEYEALRLAIGDIADRFRTVFERHLWSDFVEGGMQAEHIPELTDAVSRLAHLGSALVTAELNARFADFVEAYVSEARDAQSPRGDTDDGPNGRRGVSAAP